jgi:hypothetical protein
MLFVLEMGVQHFLKVSFRGPDWFGEVDAASLEQREVFGERPL